ncbi:MAG: hypothetical protein ACRD3Q_09250 [Terriglobales bacterium]
MDQKALDKALALFEGFRSNLPGHISESCVKEYHGIVDAIALATGEMGWEIFKIGDHELEKKVIGAQRMGFNGRPGHVTYSSDRRCDDDRFQRQLDALSHYLDSQGYRISNKTARPPAQQRSTHSVHIERMYGSAIQQGTTGSQITVNFDAKSAEFRTLMQDIRAKIPSLKLDADTTNQLYSDVGTIEVHIASPAPKLGIVAECLSSIRVILESAAGNAIAAGIIYEIAKYLSHHH